MVDDEFNLRVRLNGTVTNTARVTGATPDPGSADSTAVLSARIDR